MTISGFPNIRVIIREAEDENLTLDVPNINVIVEKDADYNVNVTPAAVVPQRTGSYQRFADVALLAYTASYVSGSNNAISSSYALTASYAERATDIFPYSGSAVITGSLFITSSTAGPSLTVVGSDIYVRGIRIGGGPNGAISDGYNIVFGDNALENVTTGVYNTAIGHETLASTTVGFDNTAIGYHALSSSFSGSNNVAVGTIALARDAFSNENVAVGSATMFYNVSGSYNTALGAFANLHGLSGSFNTAVGQRAHEFGQGSSNTVVGAQAAKFISGSYNTYLGRFNGNQNGYDFRSGSNFIVFSDGQSNVRAYYDGLQNKWVWNVDGITGVTLDTSSFTSNVPVIASEFTGSLYGTASVADGIDVIFAGTFETGSSGFIIPAPSGGLSYITSASYALTASYALNGGGGGGSGTSGTSGTSGQNGSSGTSGTSPVLSSGIVSSSTQITNYNIFATTGSNTFNGNQTITGSLITNADTLTFTGSIHSTGSNTHTGTQAITGSLNVSGSIKTTNVILPVIAPTTPATGSIYFSGSFIYVYDGTQYRSASLA